MRRELRDKARASAVPRAGHLDGSRAQDQADREKMSEGLQRLAEEDPTFRCFTNEETGQLIIAGMGELHLEIIRDRLFREFKVGANAGAPQIAYRETVTKGHEGEGKFISQSGGR